jgi:hypothetical protein
VQIVEKDHPRRLVIGRNQRLGKVIKESRTCLLVGVRIEVVARGLAILSVGSQRCRHILGGHGSSQGVVRACIGPPTASPANREILLTGTGEQLGGQGSLADSARATEQDRLTGSVVLDRLEMTVALGELLLTPEEDVFGVFDGLTVVVDAVWRTLGSDSDWRAVDDASDFTDGELAAAVFVVDELDGGSCQFLPDGRDALGALGGEFNDSLAVLAGALLDQSPIAQVIDSSRNLDAAAEPLFWAANGSS